MDHRVDHDRPVNHPGLRFPTAAGQELAQTAHLADDRIRPLARLFRITASATQHACRELLLARSRSGEPMGW